MAERRRTCLNKPRSFLITHTICKNLLHLGVFFPLSLSHKTIGQVKVSHSLCTEIVLWCLGPAARVCAGYLQYIYSSLVIRLVLILLHTF